MTREPTYQAARAVAPTIEALFARHLAEARQRGLKLREEAQQRQHRLEKLSERLNAVAREIGTPVYVYSRAAIEESFRRFDQAFSSVPHLVCYAAKANSSLAILKHLASLNAGADVVSGGELRACLESGFPADRIVFSGVGKTGEEIARGVAAGLLAFNAESEREIEKIDAEAGRQGKTARVALRVNPDIDARSHPYISTGLKHNTSRSPGYCTSGGLFVRHTCCTNGQRLANLQAMF